MYPTTTWKSLQAEPELCLRMAELNHGIEVRREFGRCAGVRQ